MATHLSFPSVCHVAVDGDAFVGYRAPGSTDRLLGFGATDDRSRISAVRKQQRAHDQPHKERNEP